MTTDDQDRPTDTTSDPELRAALREHEDRPPLDAVDWAALQRRVAERAAPTMARRRRRVRRRHLFRRARRGLLPAAVAAGIALVLLGRPDPPGVPGPEIAAPAPDPAHPARLTVEDAITADLSEADFRALASGYADTGGLLLLAAGES